MKANLQEIPLKRPCPLCGHGRGLVLYDLAFQLFDDCPLPSAFAVVACARCGFVFYDTLCGESDFVAYYTRDSSYSNTRTTGAGGETPLERVRFERTAACLKRFVPDRDAAIFDIGCGKGGLLNELKRQGYTRLHAVDMIPACIDHVRDSLGISGKAGSACEIPFPEIKADLLVYSHILEHVYDLPRAVRHARDRLNEKGLVYVEVPDARKYAEYFIFPFYYFFLEHINHFDPVQMIRLFAVNGFVLVDSGEKIFTAAAGMDIPCIHFVFRKSGRPDRGQLQADFGLAEALLNYVELCKTRENHEVFNRLSESREPVYVWGLSQNTMRLLAQTALGACKIKGFIDNDENKQRKTINGLPVLPPEALKQAVGEEAVVIAVPNYKDEIMNYLRSIHFRGKMIIPG